MKHVVSGHNFHGWYSVGFYGPEKGFELSPYQVNKYLSTLCGIADCCCGGGYGEGPDNGVAYVKEFDYDRYWLTPAKKVRFAEKAG